MKDESVNKGKINWDSLCSSTFKSAENLKNIKQSYPLIKRPPIFTRRSFRFLSCRSDKSLHARLSCNWTRISSNKKQMIDGKYAYINLPDIGSFNNDDWNEYINTFYKKVNDLQKQKTYNWEYG